MKESLEKKGSKGSEGSEGSEGKVSPDGDEFYMLPGGSENQTTSLRSRKCTPSTYGTSPRESMSLDSQSLPAPYESSSFATPEGEVLAALCFEMLMSSKAGHRANFPLRGKWCAAPKGVHFRRAAGPVVRFSLARQGDYKGFI